MKQEQQYDQIKLGLDLEDYRWTAKCCMGCASCKWVDFIYIPGLDFSWRCPSWLYYQFDAHSACGKCRIVTDLLNKRLDYSSPTLQKVVYACTMCGACDAGCKRILDLEPLMMQESLRARMVELGYGPMPQHKTMTENIVKSKNRYNYPQAKRLNWIPKDVKPAAKADILYFAGCRASFVNTEIAQAAARIMQAAKLDFMVMQDEACCGNYVYSTGQVDKARKIAEDNIKLVAESEAKQVIFSCAECYKTFKIDYPKLMGKSTSDLPFEMVHLVELIDPWVQDGRLKLTDRVDMTVTYHDACHLGRMSEPWVHWEGKRVDWGILEPNRKWRRGTYGVYEPPRNILKAIPGIELEEMFRHHENAWCCGNASGAKEAFPDFASWTVGERLREVHATTGAEAIVSACPGCKENFSQSIKVTGDSLKVYDILELVAEAIGK